MAQRKHSWQDKKHIEILRGKVDHSIILSDVQENRYYQLKTNLATDMRKFNNWIKSILMYTVFNPLYHNGKKMNILDIGIGRGGDIMKYYYVTADLVVGIDPDYNNLISPTDGALSKYNQLRKNKPNFPKMFFVQADAGVVLNYEEQNKALGGMADSNRNVFLNYFSSDNKRYVFDMINCQFVFHYLLQNNTTWTNLLTNINMYLKKGGYMIITTFDADKIITLLKTTGQHTFYYTNSTGEKKVLYDLVKKYDDTKKIELGAALDVHNSSYMQEGKYITEYLVQKDFVISEFKKHCNMVLEDTDTFDNLYEMNRAFFETSCEAEQNPSTRKVHTDTKKFYDLSSDMNKSSYEFTRLNRYYVFRKN